MKGSYRVCRKQGAASCSRSCVTANRRRTGHGFRWHARLSRRRSPAWLVRRGPIASRRARVPWRPADESSPRPASDPTPDATAPSAVRPRSNPRPGCDRSRASGASSGMSPAIRAAVPARCVEYSILSSALRGRRVEIAHQHGVRMLAEQLGDEAELAHARGRPSERCAMTTTSASSPAETRPQRAAARECGRAADSRALRRAAACEQAIARCRQPRHAPVRLMAPERKLGGFGEVLRLVEETRAQAARIGFLQADEVELADHAREHVEVRALAGRQHVFPAVRDVVAIAAHAAAGEDVAAQELQAFRSSRRALGGGRRGMLHGGEASGALSGRKRPRRQARAACRAGRRRDLFLLLRGFRFAAISFLTSQSTSSISCG